MSPKVQFLLPPSLQVDFEVADETWPCPQNLIKSRHTENQQVTRVDEGRLVWISSIKYSPSLKFKIPLQKACRVSMVYYRNEWHLIVSTTRPRIGDAELHLPDFETKRALLWPVSKLRDNLSYHIDSRMSTNHKVGFCHN